MGEKKIDNKEGEVRDWESGKENVGIFVFNYLELGQKVVLWFY